MSFHAPPYQTWMTEAEPPPERPLLRRRGLRPFRNWCSHGACVDLKVEDDILCAKHVRLYEPLQARQPPWLRRDEKGLARWLRRLADWVDGR